MGVSAKEKYLLGLLTDIKREIICQDVLRENKSSRERTNGLVQIHRQNKR